MRIVELDELMKAPGGYVQAVRHGEEIVLCDGGVPVARILPFDLGPEWDSEAHLVASGAMKMPEVEKEIDWDVFFCNRTGNVSHDVAVQAALDSRVIGKTCVLGDMRTCPASVEKRQSNR